MKETHDQQYKKLQELSTRITTVDGIAQLLNWDQETYMPKDASPVRAKQMELLAEMAHSIKTSSEYESCISSLIDLPSGAIKATTLEAEDQDALREFRRDFVRQKKLPTSFVQEFAVLTCEAMTVWQKAKHENRFSDFEPFLQKIIDMQRKKADLLGYDEHPYDALLEDYEPGCTTKFVDETFYILKEKLAKFVAKIRKEPKSYMHVPVIPATREEQLQVCHTILQLIGFDFNRGRLDVSAHPFSSSYHPWDSRITTRIESNGILSQILTTLHEAGHSFYEMGLPVKHWGTPLGHNAGLGIHESQSRLWETRIGKSYAFWEYLFPKLQAQLTESFKGVDLETFYTSINIVQPSLIRVDADEVTYPLHVVLRFEIEKELIEGTLKTKDIPSRWNDGMQALLGVVPPQDSQGCLQDIHWSMGAFGYFPTYTLGNIYAAQMFLVMTKEYPDWENRLRQGEFTFIKTWLSKNVWAHGKRYNAKTLIEKITGSSINPTPYLDYLITKHEALFCT